MISREEKAIRHAIAHYESVISSAGRYKASWAIPIREGLQAALVKLKKYEEMQDLVNKYFN